MVRKASMASLREMSRKQLSDRVGRLEVELHKVRRDLMEEDERTLPRLSRVTMLGERRKTISIELRKTFGVYVKKGKAMRRKK